MAVVPPPLAPAGNIVGRPGKPGLPGVNAVPADEAVGTYVGTDGTNSANSVDQRILRRLPFTTPEIHGAVGDGVANDTTAVLAAYATGASVILSKRYAVAGQIIHGDNPVTGSHTPRFSAANAPLSDPDESGLIAYDSTFQYVYGTNTAGSIDDNPGPLRNVLIDGRNIAGANGLFIGQGAQSTVANVSVLNSAGDVTRLNGMMQNSTFDTCYFAYSPSAALRFTSLAGGQGPGHNVFRNCYLGEANKLVWSDAADAAGWSHDNIFDSCILEVRQNTIHSLINAQIGEMQFRSCTITRSAGAGTTVTADCLVLVENPIWTTASTKVSFDSCYFNGGTVGVTDAIRSVSSTSVANNVVVHGDTWVTKCTNIVCSDGANGLVLSVLGNFTRGSGVGWWRTVNSGHLAGFYNLTAAPTRYATPNVATLRTPIQVAHDDDNASFNRWSVDRDGVLYWQDGASVTVRGSIGRNVTDNAMELGGIWRVQNGIAYRGIVLANVTTAGQSVAFSGASSASPNQIVQFTVNGASANATISGGVAGSQLQVMLDASTLTSGQTASITWPANMVTDLQPVQGKVVTVSFVLYGSTWYEISRGTGTAPGGSGTSWKTGTSSTAIGTAAKTVTISGYTPAAGDVLYLTLTNGNTAAAPTLSVNGGAAKNIKVSGNNAAAENLFSAAGAVWPLYYDGTSWHTNNDTIAILATVAQMQAGTSTTVAWMTPSLVAAAIAVLNINAQTASYTLVASDAGKCVEVSNASANTVSIPPNSSVAFAVGTVIEVRQTGAGTTSIAAGSGVTLRVPATARAQYSTIRLHKVATDTWQPDGDYV